MENEAIVNFVNDASDDDKALILSLMPHDLILNELNARLDDFAEMYLKVSEMYHSMGRDV